MKKFFKTYVVDALFLVFFFYLVVFAKKYIETFFDKVSVYEEALLSFDPDLTNATVEMVNQMDLVIGNFGDLVYTTLLVMLVLIPLIFFLVLILSQSLNIALLRKKLYPKRIVKSVLIFLPIFIIYLIFQGFVTTTLANFLEIPSQLWLVSIVVLAILLLSYLWLIATVILMAGKKLRKNLLKLIYKKSYILFPIYLLFGVMFILVLVFNSFMAFRELTDSFVQNSFFNLILLQAIILVPIQVIRMWLVKKVQKFNTE